MHTGLERLANLPGFMRGRLAREGRGEVVVTDAGGPDLSRSVSSNPHGNSETAHRNRLSCGDRSSHTVRQPGAEARGQSGAVAGTRVIDRGSRHRGAGAHSRSLQRNSIYAFSFGGKKGGVGWRVENCAAVTQF